MAKFQKTIKADLLDGMNPKPQCGQWIDQGGEKGQYFGTKPSGTHVVMWQKNHKSADSRKEYRKALLNYAKGGRI